ncbi:bifunctional riboflavin kinase/FAD synthetase [Sulfurospirillum arcachonense]|uniref:bifunctional riboflavin kinase/FAD synthetase n=1 Tax=Sulfurospirillum arcachonense TaxID=57666 RepID=UPI00046A2D50|nr:bifunctional riboflavin kinase/FAD synthetase [Sulfurospirillum arcachonense]
MQRPSTILIKDKIDTIAIGSFDGIHLGHMQLINRLGENGALLVIDKDHSNLTPGLKRTEYSKVPCMFYHFLKVKNLSGEEFIQIIKKEFSNLKKIIVGYDFQFGRKRSCTANDLLTLYDGEIEIVEEFFYKGVSVHSSIIRELLTTKKVDEANVFFGREYSVCGKVVKGQGLGKKELFPTINIKIQDYLLPSDGVYASRTKVGEKIYDSVSFIGNRVSTDGNFSIETHILDKNIVVEDEIEIYFVKYLRENKKFDDLSILKKQIEIDINSARSVLNG